MGRFAPLYSKPRAAAGPRAFGFPFIVGKPAGRHVEAVGNARVHAGYRRAERNDRGDNGAGDAGGDQGVFDGRGPAVVAQEVAQAASRYSPGHWRLLHCRYSACHNSAIKCEISGTSAGGIS